MLEELTISGLGVIDSATLELGPGFTVVTGETGAGKTMVVTALALLLGARSDVGAVRQGADRARVEGRLGVMPEGPVAGRAAEAGAALDDDAIILARTVTAEGRSRAHAGGVGVPATLLADLAADLVVIHGQSGAQEILRPSRQRDYLDAFGGQELLDVRSSYRHTYDELGAVSAYLDDVVSRRRERAREADLLRLGLTEIEAADPQPGEDEALKSEESRLGHVDGLRRAADEARLALSGDDTSQDVTDALALVAGARKSLEAERDHDGQLADLADQLATASYGLADVAADISAYAVSLETDPLRLAAVQDRRGLLGALTKKYGDTIDDVLSWRDRAAGRLGELVGDDGRVEELRADQRRLLDELAGRGGRLTDLRRAAGAELERRITTELSGLAMPDARFRVEVTGVVEPTRDGFDDATFLLSAHPGSDPRPLQRGASGGELSRVMLAVEVCLAGRHPVPTMIFDEVDAGVGGKAAVEVGRRLSRLARSVQVVVVTHLPQVAAFADRHYAVVKASDGSVTTSGVTVLDEAARRRELSRMLAGLEGSDAALAHADELVALGERERRT